MLRLKDVEACKSPIIEIDEYVPLTIEFGSQSISPLYWRGGDGSLSLIEIGLCEDSGAINSATLTSIAPACVLKTTEPLNSTLPEIEGIVVFDISDWSRYTNAYSDKFKDDFGSSFDLIIGDSYAVIVLAKDNKPARYVKNGQIRIGISPTGDFSTLEIMELTPNQIELLQQACNIS